VAEVLYKEGIGARVIEMHTIKPIDTQSILEAARETGAIVTVEEHSIIDGLGAAVAEVVTESYPVPVKRAGIVDKFTETGPYNDLLEHYGMSQKEILEAAHKVLKMKKKLS
jgi:transketolase